MENKVAPEEILEFLVSYCKRGKCAQECQCAQLKIPCTDIYKCKNCCNNQIEFGGISDDEVEED